MRKNTSLLAFWLCAALLVAAAALYYPKWEKPHTEATISWDVSGYYLYLPGALIYKDLKKLSWWAGIEEKYRPGPGMGQAYPHPSGNFVMKYPMGQALQFLPWFAVAHTLAEPLGYPADGFSKPYQMAIGWGSLLVALLGLWFLRKVLLYYFSDAIVAIVLVCLVFGSNYLEYASITGAMTHNWLFTLYTLLIFNTIQFYRRPTWLSAACIGMLVGWATITRPTEIIAALIPLFWGVGSWAALRERLFFFKGHWPKMGLASACAGGMVFLQLAYWKYATGEWVVYSYQDQTFTWFPPHIEDVLWSARAGWLVYSPMMLFAVAGIFMLRKRLPDVFPAVITYCLTALYITSAWDIWWYGGSLGQRAMVQAYPLWAFGLGAFWMWALGKNWRKYVFVGLAVICIYLNLWWSHQAHRGGLFESEKMTRAYLLKVLGRFEKQRDWLKLLDTREEFTGNERHNLRTVLSMGFDTDTTAIATSETPISGAKSLLLGAGREFTPEYDLPIKPNDSRWLRTFCRFRCDQKEWETWKMTNFIVRFRQGDKIVKERSIKLQRHIDGNETQSIFFDTQLPPAFDRAAVFFWNPGSTQNIRIDDLTVEVFD